ncbi:HAD-IC family P-type ATPase [uncultured Ruminococcus sp.]|uniref:HAD-IC family P-type ATPase n=1 Tax=uncultured Ruminococcus sp. TaxID=165186 RepID=UPI0026759800|nr:HAD-IC family P-type ATPase [uncultured Ruminococcus sp.]
MKRKASETAAKTTGQILRDNICTLFNLLNLLIAIALIFVHAWSNLFFVPVVALNTIIGIAQELKAKRLIEKLTLLSQSNAKIERNGELHSVPIAEVQEQDILLLESGNQICADAVVTDGSIEVNESLLTGESDAVYKKAGDSLLSGSSVISGTCRATVLRVGSDSYASKLTKEAKKTKAMHSELVSSMQKVTRLTSFCIVPLGILLFVEALLFRDSSMYDAVVGTSAGLLGMLPKGLYLLISVSLAAGIITLSKKNVLVQDLYSLENLAHVDVLCLDKTGTLTEGKMQVEKADLFPGTDAEKFHEWMGNFLTHTQDNNATFQAMHAYFKGMDTLSVTDQIPFSSDRKWSAMTFAGAGTFVTGAPEKLCPDQMPPEITAYQKEGKRVLLAGITQQPVQKGQPLPEVQLLAVIVLTDPLRANAAKTIANFQKEGVSVKLISGDNPVTASAVAQKAGILHGDRWVDMRTVEESEIDAAAQRYTVFGRVTPQQKKQLIQAFHRQKHTVAMTGDGVNDLLALKEADCSISVGQGSDAARQTAQLVLLDSDFAVLKDVLLEGRRVVHNVTRSAGVFFIKTLYSVLLCAICLLTNTPFPFVPIQITLIDLIIEGYPSFFLSFLPDSRPVHTRFLPEAIRRAAPNAIAIGVCFLFYLLFHAMGLFGLSGEQTQANALLFLLIGTVGLAGVFKMCQPFTKIKAFFAVTSAIGFYAAIAVCLWLQNHLLHLDILHLAVPTPVTLLFFVLLAIAAILTERTLAKTIFRDKAEIDE